MIFFLNRNDHENYRGVEKYEGYAVDFVQKLSELMNFEYDFMIVKGNGKFNPTTQTWDGIIGKLIDHVSLDNCFFWISELIKLNWN